MLDNTIDSLARVLGTSMGNPGSYPGNFPRVAKPRVFYPHPWGRPSRLLKQTRKLRDEEL
jgi:hypothetical protein